MARQLQIGGSRARAKPIDGDQFRFGLGEAQLTAERFADLFCNGRIERVREWSSGAVPVPPWVPALLAAMVAPEGRMRAIATAEHLIAVARGEDKKSSPSDPSA